MTKYLEKLNPQQREAATSIHGMNFILAGAGSGKTATLVARVAYMIEQGIDPQEILLLTFTNKAAKEMKDRIKNLIGEKATKVTACTFHSFCAMFLRQNARLLAFDTDFTIIDSPDMMDALSISKQSFLAQKKKEGKEYNLKDFPSTLQIGKIYEASVNNSISPENIIGMQLDMVAYKKDILEILALFKKYKKDRNLMDYNDLLYYTKKLLETDSLIRERMDNKYKFISCDEFQDTNTVQNQILNLLTRDYPNLTVVGDDNQSIYAFRYANIDNILNFDKVHSECKTVVLDQNYRSSQAILDFSNSVMKYAKEGKKKTLKGLFSGEKPFLIVKNDCYDEADYIIKKILEKDCDLSDIAVICRSANQSYILEQKLNILGIPFNKFGGLKFMEKVVIKDLLAFLRISVNEKDELALFRILQLYPGIGKTYAQKISSIIATDDIKAAQKTYAKRNFSQYIKEMEEVIEKIKQFNLKEQLEYLIQDYYKNIVKRKIELQNISDSKKEEAYLELDEALKDAENLQVMANKYRSASSFLNDIILDATVEENEDVEKLNITTIHSAKGLEYDIVFVLDCIEGVTPRCSETSFEDSEELRCFYVAITRAKKELYIMVPKYYNFKNLRGTLSHFINKTDILKTCKRNIDNHQLMCLISPPQYTF